MNRSARVFSAVLALAVSGAAAEAAQVTVIAQGLASPRGIAFAPNGTLYVAEAGSGGNGQCLPSPDNPNAVRCYGETGALTRIDPTGVSGPARVVSGLPSIAFRNPDMTFAAGAVDVAFFGMNAYVVMGWGGNPAGRAGLGPKSDLFGSLLRVLPNGRYEKVADVSDNETANNPAGGPVDSNPYGVAALPGRQVVADAGANALIETYGTHDMVHAGVVRTLAVLPTTVASKEPVPTTVTEGPDGDLYVGELTGAPYLRGTSTIYRVAPDGSSVSAYAGGFTAVVDMAFDPSGNLYVLEIASGFVPGPGANPGLGVGRLVRLATDGTREVVMDGLSFPGGVTVGPDGAIYVTNKGVSATHGEVRKLMLN